MSNWTIHIGPGKTGTTFLQEVVLGRCEGLVAAGRPNHKRPEYQAFYRAVTREEDDVAALTTIRAFVEAETRRAVGRPVVLSDETLALAPMWTVVARRLSQAVPDAQILLTIRSQFTAIPSYYANHGRALSDVPEPYRGRHVDLNHWFDHAVRHGRCDYIKAIDYQELASTFLRYFPDRVHMVTYEEMIADKVKFGERLSQLFGVDVGALVATPARVNPRQSRRALYYRKLRSKLLPAVRFSKLLPPGHGVQRLAERFLKGGSAIEVVLTDEQKNVIRDRYAASNDWIRRRFQLALQHDYPLPP